MLVTTGLLLFSGLCLALNNIALAEGDRDCQAVILAEDESIHSELLTTELTTSQKIFNDLWFYDSSLQRNLVIKADLKSIIAYLEAHASYQAAWQEALPFITDVTKFSNDNEFIPFCQELVGETTFWRDQNYVLEMIIHKMSNVYQDIIACSDSNDGCTYNLHFLISAIYDNIQSESRDTRLQTFRSLYVQINQKYNAAMSKLNLISAIILWIKSLKLMGVDSFDSELTQADYDNIEHKVKQLDRLLNTRFEISTIWRAIREVNDEKRDVTDLFDYIPSMNSRHAELTDLITFLEESVGSLRTLAAYVRDNTPTVQYWSDTREVGEGNHGYALRRSLITHLELIQDDLYLSIQRRDYSHATYQTTEDDVLNGIVIEEHIKRAKTHFGILTMYNSYATSYLRCTMECADVGRALALIYRRRSQMNNAVTGSSPVEDFIRKNTELMTIIRQFLTNEIWDLHGYNVYMTTLEAGVPIRDPIFRKGVPSLEQLESYDVILTHFKQTINLVFSDLCESNKNTLFSHLVLESAYESPDLFSEDSTIASATVSTSLTELMNNVIDSVNLTHPILNELYVQTMTIFQDANATMHDTIGDTLTEKLNQFVPRIEILETNASSLRSRLSIIYPLPSHAAAIALNKISEEFPIGPSTAQYRDSNEGQERRDNSRVVDLSNDPVGLLGGILTDGTTVNRAVRNEIDKFTRSSGLVMYKSRGDGLIFELPHCSDYCIYNFEFTDITSSHIAIGVGELAPFHDYLVLDGIFYEHDAHTKADKSSLSIVHNIFQSQINIVYMNHHKDKYPFHIQSGLVPNPRFTPMFVFDNTLRFVVGMPHGAAVSAVREVPGETYDIYRDDNQHTPKYIYIKKAHLRENGWVKVNRRGNDTCLAIGVAFAVQDEFGRKLVSGLYFDGANVVYNPVHSCVYNFNMPMSGQTPGDASTLLDILYMKNSSDPEDSNYTVKLDFWSRKLDHIYRFQSNEVGVPPASFIFGQMTDNTVDRIERWRVPPEELPTNNVKIVCKADADCDDAKICHYRSFCRHNGADCVQDRDCNDMTNGECITGREWRFGTCEIANGNPPHEKKEAEIEKQKQKEKKKQEKEKQKINIQIEHATPSTLFTWFIVVAGILFVGAVAAGIILSRKKGQKDSSSTALVATVVDPEKPKEKNIESEDTFII